MALLFKIVVIGFLVYYGIIALGILQMFYNALKTYLKSLIKKTAK